MACPARLLCFFANVVNRDVRRPGGGVGVTLSRDTPMPPLASDDAHWFTQRLLPHEPMLRAWLRRMFPSGCEIDDVVQEAYFRVARTGGP